jgi:N-acetylglucosamine-6-phosphate deacetylase
MRGAGMGEGPSMIGRIGESVPCVIEDGVAKLLDRSAFAGSVATADLLIRTMVKEAGVSVPESVKMMTQNPAGVLGLTDKGDIADGFDADIVIFDSDINIKNIILAGNLTGIV